MPALALFALVISLAALWSPTPSGAQTAQVDAFLSKEKPLAQAGLFANIGGVGSKAAGAKPGLVIASPSTTDPNYFYFWLRDGSLVFKHIIDQVVSGQDTDPAHRTLIDQFVAAVAALQNVDNRSGNVASGLNLGEPKFNVDGSADNEDWGRPQRDGPPLRITALTTYAKYLISQRNTTYVSETIWPIISRDAEYTRNTWSQTGVDLWEEINTFSFFTTAMQHRGMRDAIALAKSLEVDPTLISKWTETAQQILCFLQSYYSFPASYIFSNTAGGRVGLDANSILASIHTYDSDAGCDATTFQPCSDKALASLVHYVDSFRGGLYPINKDSDANRSVGIAVGRYKEDVYFGGNPWYLTTLAVAEQLHLSLKTWSKIGSITVTNTSLPFFQLFIPSITPSTYTSSSSTFKTLISSITTYADSFISIVARYTPSSGSLSEQYHKEAGDPTSAVDLTWSYASLLTLVDARNGVTSGDKGETGNKWGAKGLGVDDTCAYKDAGTSMTFYVNATTVFGESIYLTGSVSALSYWYPPIALQLSTSESTYPTWSVTVSGLPAGTKVEYKYRKGTTKEGARWSGGANYVVETGARGEKGEVRDVFRD